MATGLFELRTKLIEDQETITTLQDGMGKLGSTGNTIDNSGGEQTESKLTTSYSSTVQ
jgi:hypothetical protein